jgi:hypothetical protein
VAAGRAKLGLLFSRQLALAVILDRAATHYDTTELAGAIGAQSMGRLAAVVPLAALQKRSTILVRGSRWWCRRRDKGKVASSDRRRLNIGGCSKGRVMCKNSQRKTYITNKSMQPAAKIALSSLSAGCHRVR